jgi:FkbM family methyltransferase
MARELVMSIDAMPDHVWEPQTTKVLLHFCKDVEHVIIGGGYVGDQAVIVAKEMQRSGGVCHVFELNPESYKLLEMNAKDNGLDNIKPNNLGLWSDDSSSLILVGEDDISAYPEAVENAQIVEKQAMPTVSINSYGEKQGIECLGLLMLDIEGGEFEALKGADRYLAQPIEEAPVVVFEVHRHYCDWSRGLERTPIIEYLKKFGYYFCAIRDYQAHVPMEGRPVELIPLEKTVLEGPPHGFNLIGVKDKALLENDLFVFCHDVSPKLLKHKDPKLHQPEH